MGYAGSIDSPKNTDSLVAAMPAPSAEPDNAAPLEVGAVPASDHAANSNVSAADTLFAQTDTMNAPAPENTVPAGIPTPVNSIPTPVSSGIVTDNAAAMGTGSPYAAGIPTPVNSVPTPVNSVPVPTDSSASYGYSPVGGAASPAAASAQSAAPGAPADAFGDLGFAGAEAMAVNPIKKHKGGKVGLIIAAAAVVIVAVLAVVFLLNKGPVMKLFMGESRYASMIEGNGLKTVVDYVEDPVVVNGIKTASTYYAAADIAYDGYDSSDSADLNFAAVIEALNDSMLEAYGVNSMSATIVPSITLTDTSKALITGYALDAAELDEIIAAINDLKLSYDITSEKDAAEFAVEVSEGGLTVNAQAVILSDGNIYLSFPFGSDKAIKYTVEQGEAVSAEEAPVLELDEEEISRILGELVDVYLTYYENSEITIEDNGEISAAGAVAYGTMITATIDNAAIEDMFAEFGSIIAEDKYLRDKIVAYANDCGMDYTEADYKNDIEEGFSVSVDSRDSLVIKSIIDKNNNVLAKSYTAYDDDDSISFAFIDGDAGDTNTSAFEMSESSDSIMLSARITKSSDTDGTINVMFTADDADTPFAVKIDYSDFMAKQFLGNDIYTGTFTVSVTPPADFTESIDSTDAAVLAALSASTFTVSSDVSGNTLNGTISVDVPQYGSASLTMTMSGSDGSVSIPSNVIEVSDDMSAEDMDAATEEIMELLAELSDKITSSDSYFAEVLADVIGSGEALTDYPFDGGYADPIASEPYADENAVDEFFDRLYNDIDTVSNLYYTSELTDEQESKADDILERLYDLLYDVGYYISESELESYSSQLTAIEKEISALKSEAAVASPFVPDESVDYSDMSYEELSDAFSDLANRYIALYLMCDYSALDAELQNKYDNLSDIYNEAYEDFLELFEAMQDGELSLPLLRDVRASLQALDDSISELESAAYSQIGSTT